MEGHRTLFGFVYFSRVVFFMLFGLLFVGNKMETRLGEEASFRRTDDISFDAKLTVYENVGKNTHKKGNNTEVNGA